MSDLNDYRAFLSVVERGSLTAAARQSGRSLQSISRSLASLERELGVELVRRTTRTSRPTDAGFAFYLRIKAAMGDIDLARSEVSEGAANLAGKLRVGAPVLFAPTYLMPATASFLSRYPRMEIEFALTEQYADLIAEGLDLAIRIGPLADSALKARKLGELRRVAFAAPSYLAAHGRPVSPADLTNHQCVVRGSAKEGRAWTFKAGAGEETITVKGRFAADGSAMCNEAVVLGLGIGIAPLWQIRGLVDQGRVELILSEYEPRPVPIYAVWSATPALPTRVRAYLEFVASRVTADRL